MAFSPDYRAYPTQSATTSAVLDAGLRAYMLRVYNWMASGLLLTALAISLVGQGVRALQEGGYVSLTPIGNARGGLPTLGLYPTLEGLGTQLVVLVLVLLPIWTGRKRAPAPKLA